MIHQAIFTEPDDQTAWWYHRFIVDAFLESPPTLNQESEKEIEEWEKTVEIYSELFLNELELLRELLLTEDGECKWALLAMHMVLGKLKDVNEANKINDEYFMEQLECLEALMEIDPDRMKRYESMEAKIKAEAN